MDDIVPIEGDIVPQWIQPFYEHAVYGGWQKLYRFSNGYGASVVDTPENYSGGGTWEMAVIYWRGAGIRDWEIVSDTPVTHDVLGWQTDAEVEVTLRAIQALPERRKEITG